jgi:hypothetical protein
MRAARERFVAGIVGCLALSIPLGAMAQSPGTFEDAVVPVLTDTCGQCHNDTLSSGGLSVGHLAERDSIVEHREDWDRILRRVEAGEMPPSGVTRPPAPILDAFISTIER